jgi:hypothetical protein
VFAHHTAVLDAIENACLTGPQGRRGVRIDGATPPAARQAALNAFQGDPQCRVALLSITAAGVKFISNTSVLKSNPEGGGQHVPGRCSVLRQLQPQGWVVYVQTLKTQHRQLRCRSSSEHHPTRACPPELSNTLLSGERNAGQRCWHSVLECTPACQEQPACVCFAWCAAAR